MEVDCALCASEEAAAAGALGAFAPDASSPGSVAHLFLELSESTCDSNAGQNCGRPVLSPESESVSDSFKTLIFLPRFPIEPLAVLVKIIA